MDKNNSLSNKLFKQSWFFSPYAGFPSDFVVKLDSPLNKTAPNSELVSEFRLDQGLILPTRRRLIKIKDKKKKPRFSWNTTLNQLFLDLLLQREAKNLSTKPSELCHIFKEMIESDENRNKQYSSILPLLTREVISSHVQKMKKRNPLLVKRQTIND